MARGINDEERNEGLCDFQKDGSYCPNTKVDPGDNQFCRKQICFCEQHQGIPRFVLLSFDDAPFAEEVAQHFRFKGHNANTWQGCHVIIGPTNEVSAEFAFGYWVNKTRGHFEAMMYEDALMAAIKHLGLDMSHIIQGGSTI